MEKNESKQQPEGKPIDYHLSCCSINSSAILVVSGYVNQYAANFLIDSGASSSFISEKYVQVNHLKTRKVNVKRIRLANGQLLTTSRIVRDADINIHGRSVKLDLIVLELNHEVILGINWLSAANPTINFSTRTIQFSSMNECNDDVLHASFQPEQFQPVELNLLNTVQSPPLVNDSSVVQISNLELLKSIDPYYLNKQVVKSIERDDILCEVRVFDHRRTKARLQLEHHLNAVSVEDAMNSVADEVRSLIESYRELFRDKLPPGLPPRRVVDHRINLKSETTPFNQHSYRMNQVELAALRKQLDELLEQRFIEPSLSEYGSPCLFVKKKSGELRLVVDYRKLNQMTLRMNYSHRRELGTVQRS